MRLSYGENLSRARKISSISERSRIKTSLCSTSMSEALIRSSILLEQGPGMLF
jgi:hypothetical protein